MEKAIVLSSFTANIIPSRLLRLQKKIRAVGYTAMSRASFQHTCSGGRILDITHLLIMIASTLTLESGKFFTRSLCSFISFSLFSLP